MQANWSLILNVLLLVGVIAAMGRLMKVRKQSLNSERYKPSVGQVGNSPYGAEPYHDDIIAVRKVSQSISSESECLHDKGEQRLKKTVQKTNAPRRMPPHDEPKFSSRHASRIESEETPSTDIKSRMPSSVMMFLLAKENRQFAGYDLLQTVLASGFRFGEGHLFHRHQLLNGQGLVLCSLAAATTTGVFDLQNIGAFSVRGLCLFMNTSNDSERDAESFSVMFETAQQLRDGLDAYLLDDKRRPFTSESLAHYHQLLNLSLVE